jgi:hypothetical protein
VSREELYQWAIDRAQNAVAGGKAGVAKLQEHLESKQAWLDEATAELARLEELGLEGFLQSLVDSGEATSEEVQGSDAPGAVGAAAHNATASTVDGTS